MSEKRRKSVAPKAFVELAGQLETAPPQAAEFRSFVDLWKQPRLDSGSRVDGGDQQEPIPEAARPEPDSVERARLEAEEIIARAQAEAESLRQEAREKGRAEAQKDYAGRIANLKKVVAEILLQRGAIIQRYREDLLTLVQAMTDRLVHHEVSVNPAVIKACLQQAVELVVEKSSVQAHVSPEDLRYLSEAGLREPTLLGGKNQIRLVADPVVAQGGCLLKSAFGEVDATLDNCREKLYQAVARSFQAALAASAGEDEEPPAANELAAVWPEAEDVEVAKELPAATEADEASGETPAAGAETPDRHGPTGVAEVGGEVVEPGAERQAARAEETTTAKTAGEDFAGTPEPVTGPMTSTGPS